MASCIHYHCRFIAWRTCRLAWTHKKIKHKGSEIDLAAEVNDATKSADELLVDSNSSNNSEKDRLWRLADDSPRGAILDSWLSVEGAMNQYTKRHGIHEQNHHSPPYQTIQNIQLRNLDVPTLGHGIIDMLDKLRRIRNDAVHRTDADITPTVARDYAELALRVRAKLEEA